MHARRKRIHLVGYLRNRPFPDWIYRVDRFDFSERTPPAKCRRIAGDLLSHVIVPPPVLPKPGGGGVKASRGKSNSSAAGKLETLKESQRLAYERRKDYVAVRQAVRLARLEQTGKSWLIGEEYDELLKHFRVLKGFSRVLGLHGRDPICRAFLSPYQTIEPAQLQDLLASYFSFELLDRMMGPNQTQHRMPVNAATAQHVVLLKQDQLGLGKLNSIPLFNMCKRCESVAHLLVGIVGTWSRKLAVEDNLARTLETTNMGHLRELLAVHLDAVLSASLRMQEDFCSFPINRRGDVLVPAEYQVRLPDTLVVDRSLAVRGALAKDEIILLKGLVKDAALPKSDQKWSREKINSFNAKRMREEIMQEMGANTQPPLTAKKSTD
jgi:hypothetical protein